MCSCFKKASIAHLAKRFICIDSSEERAFEFSVLQIDERFDRTTRRAKPQLTACSFADKIKRELNCHLNVVSSELTA